MATRSGRRRSIARLPSDYVRACWFDTITHNERALRYVVDTVGAAVVLGSDYPADMGEPSGRLDRNLREPERQ